MKYLPVILIAILFGCKQKTELQQVALDIDTIKSATVGLGLRMQNDTMDVMWLGHDSLILITRGDFPDTIKVFNTKHEYEIPCYGPNIKCILKPDSSVEITSK